MTKQKDVNNQPKSPLRRKTIKTLAVGVGALAGSTVLPDKWVTPIIQGIALPAHAQTSAPGVTFCSGRHELTLVEGHSGTDEMTIEANGCITPAQANVELEMTLEGYDTAVITQNHKPGGGTPFSLFATISDALVPSAHAATSPKCTVKVKVKTDAHGKYKVTFKLNCGKGIVQAVMKGTIAGVVAPNLGWLDIPAGNPSKSGTDTAPCDATVLVSATAPLSVSIDEGVTWGAGPLVASQGQLISIKNESPVFISWSLDVVGCDGDVIINEPCANPPLEPLGIMTLPSLTQSAVAAAKSVRVHEDDSCIQMG
ncbi:MAG: hypothetical protein Q3M24_00060 [Candidatus Electrothrix aestuarii]|uniref:Uncharacterized protein n=1 Tax=Candidatus Electrothrix aestuarii TaxID=3062594 RepID=A0AAU8LV83_9BACT|nr:hypothetical protein [Candidatus Electrothrix aestuarii]